MMEKYELRSCTVDDAPGLGKNNASAFWAEEWWNILWENRTLDSLIDAFTARLPKMLLTERSIRRHQMIVHVSSGEVVGYARWILPESHSNEWLEAQIPDVRDQDRQRFDKTYGNADFTTRGLDDMDNPVLDMLRRHRPTEPFVSKFSAHRSPPFTPPDYVYKYSIGIGTQNWTTSVSIQTTSGKGLQACSYSRGYSRAIDSA